MVSDDICLNPICEHSRGSHRDDIPLCSRCGMAGAGQASYHLFQGKRKGGKHMPSTGGGSGPKASDELAEKLKKKYGYSPFRGDGDYPISHRPPEPPEYPQQKAKHRAIELAEIYA